MRSVRGNNLKPGDQIVLTSPKWDSFTDVHPEMYTGAVHTIAHVNRDNVRLEGSEGLWALAYDYEMVRHFNEENKPMRFLIAIEGYRGTPTSFIDITEEMLLAHPELTFKMGEVIGLYFKLGGKETRGEE